MENAMKFQMQANEGQIDALAIQRALLAVDTGLLIDLDLFAGRLSVTGSIAEEKVLQTLKGLGYRAEPISPGDCCGGCS
jgi:hypothetical protein